MEIITIRQRGQITIPKNIRDEISWLSKDSAIAVKVADEEICISPYKESAKPVDWKNIWDQIELSRSFKGKRGDLSAFIAEDRRSH